MRIPKKASVRRSAAHAQFPPKSRGMLQQRLVQYQERINREGAKVLSPEERANYQLYSTMDSMGWKKSVTGLQVSDRPFFQDQLAKLQKRVTAAGLKVLGAEQRRDYGRVLRLKEMGKI